VLKPASIVARIKNELEKSLKDYNKTPEVP
jgi:hypothetical protein